MGAHAGDVDDAALGGALFQIGVAQHAHLEDILDVGGHDGVEAVFGEIFGPAFEADTGIVDEKVDVSVVLCRDVGEDGLHSFFIRNISLEVDDALGAHARVLLRRAGAADDVDRGSGLRQDVCHGKADAAAAAGDNAGLACKCGKAHDEIFLSALNKSNSDDKIEKNVLKA